LNHYYQYCQLQRVFPSFRVVGDILSLRVKERFVYHRIAYFRFNSLHDL